ncbi:hypothetical protein [Micromonospora zamorensis]|uniref:hypothetical protein n=1 Tax=Micromonospora zamorensis TaxID=709883 RepID=UPI0033BACD42
MTSALGNLSAQQRALVDRWLPNATVEREHSWGLTTTTVVEVTHAGKRFIVKAAGADDHHIQRELHAHLNWLRPLDQQGTRADPGARQRGREGPRHPVPAR